MIRSNNIRHYRKLKGLRQYQLADKIGITRHGVLGHEKLKFGIKKSTAKKYAKALGVSVKKLFEN